MSSTALVVGYGSSRADAAGFADLNPLAARYGFDLVESDDVNDPGLVERITRLNPALIYVIGWSQIVRKPLLSVPSVGCVGIHPTKLPQGRGRAPIPWTILKGLTHTASTMFFLAEGVDDGDIIGQIEFGVDPREDAATLYAKHLAAHVELVRSFTPALLSGDAVGAPQDHTQATTWPRRTPEDGRIDWTRSAEDTDRLVRAVTRPYPGAFAETADGRVTIWQAEPGPSLNEPPGTWIRGDDDLYVACGAGSLRVLEVEGAPRVARRS